MWIFLREGDVRFWWAGGRRRLHFWTYLVCACVASRPYSNALVCLQLRLRGLEKLLSSAGGIGVHAEKLDLEAWPGASCTPMCRHVYRWN